MSGSNQADGHPCAFVVGDFNVGKSALLNALLRREILHTSREEGRALPTFIGRSWESCDRFAALSRDGNQVSAKTHDEFLKIRQEAGLVTPHCALAAGCAASPFNDLVLVDTSGMSSDACESVEIANLSNGEAALLMVVVDIEYWAAKHTMDFVAFHQEEFGDRLCIVANKADHLNASDIERIKDKAATRLEDYGINPTPRFFTLSARLETARRDHRDEYRQRTKRRVRELCDADFDALRVALYEFEAGQARREGNPKADDWIRMPLATSFIATQEGAPA
jgi:GTP-binding protein EngB required for normal cell division